MKNIKILLIVLLAIMPLFMRFYLSESPCNPTTVLVTGNVPDYENDINDPPIKPRHIESTTTI